MTARRVAVASEIRLQRGRDGIVRTTSGAGGYEFWRRYLTAFEQITVIARVEQRDDHEGAAVTGPGVTVHALDNYVGLTGWAGSLRSNRATMRAACALSDTAYIARVPGAVGSMMVSALRRTGRGYALEVVGDPESVVRSGVVPGPVAVVLAPLTARQMRAQCARARAASYVTAHELQRRYPATRAQSTSSYSSIDLPVEAFRERERHGITDLPVVLTVGSLAQPYKGHDVLIRAVGLLHRQGRPCRLRIVGSGRLLPNLTHLAKQVGVGEHVTFVGQLTPGPQVWAEFDDADLFVMPSRTEGLPRALIEAMARGVPAIGTRVGGIPELLSDADLVPPNDVGALADLMIAVLRDCDRRRRASDRNRNVAQDYAYEVVEQRRSEFYADVRALL